MKPVQTNQDITILIKDLKEDRQRFIRFMRERKNLIKEKGKEVAEAELKVKYKDKIASIKQKNK